MGSGRRAQHDPLINDHFGIVQARPEASRGRRHDQLSKVLE